MNRLLITTLVVGMVASTTYAQRGQRQGSPQDPVSKTLDIDGDGTISASEIKNATASLQSLDSDKDGTIDTTEIRQAMRASFGGGQGGAGGQRGGPGGGGSGPGSAGASTLERTGLEIGQKLPNITIHDENGGEFPITSLKGKYTVITFGCLT